jgi:hypothetical protein
MGFIAKEVRIGILTSLIATIAGAFVYLEFFSSYNFQETIAVLKAQNLYGKVLTLAAIPNLFVFFVFLKKKQDYRAKGVLCTVILIAFITFALKII